MNKNRKLLLCAGAAALAMTCVIQESGDAKIESAIVAMNANTDIESKTAVLLEDGEQGLVVEEKKAVDEAYIFDKMNEQMFAKGIVDCKAEPKDLSDTQYIVEKGTEVTVLGRNADGYLKILLVGQEVYAHESEFTSNYYEIFDDCDYTMYAARDINIYEDVELTNVISTIEQYEEVGITGTNDSGLLRVVHGDLEGYIKESSVIEYLPGQVHIEEGEHETTSLYIENMHDGILSDIPDSQKTEENIEFLAKLIHCEAGGHTVDGKLAVATVVVNRCYDGYWGDSIRSVIEAPGQFQPVSSGKIYGADYSEEDYECAYKVLVEGYRSFPAYVMYFQSIKLGYFNGSYTYCICRDENGRWPQYFSYKQSDLDKYGL